MKLNPTNLVLSSLAASSAFTPPTPAALAKATSSCAIRMSEVLEDPPIAEPPLSPPVESVSSEPPAPKLPSMSVAIPFLSRPPLLNGRLAGDFGFDPMGFADTEENLAFYANAEVKHARIAMLAAAGWPLAEMWHPQFAAMTGFQSKLVEDGRVPSVLNGGLPQVGLYMLLVLGISSTLEMLTMDSQAWGKSLSDTKKAPGSYGFDPLNLYTSWMSVSKIDKNGPNYEAAQTAARKTMELAEIKNGRLAMMGITGFAIQEFVTKQPVIDETPLFFTPAWKIALMMLGIEM